MRYGPCCYLRHQQRHLIAAGEHLDAKQMCTSEGTACPQVLDIFAVLCRPSLCTVESQLDSRVFILSSILGEHQSPHSIPRQRGDSCSEVGKEVFISALEFSLGREDELCVFNISLH